MSASPGPHTAPASPAQLLERLAELGIETNTVEHPAVFTVQESRDVRGDLPGAHCKNLLLRAKRRSLFLVVLPADQRLDLKALARELGSGRLSFEKPENASERLGIGPGAMTPFAVINDREKQVTVVMEKGLLDEEILNFHPLDNRMTTGISPRDLLKFLSHTGHEPILVSMP